MLFGNLQGRLVVAAADGAAVDVERASAGRFGPDPQAVYESWDDFAAWAATADLHADAEAQPLDPARLDAPVPGPRQVFAVALNYPEHAAEAEMSKPDSPLVFTKFPTCLVGAEAEVALPTDMVDWEVEVVLVIGKEAHGVAEADAWEHVAGVTVGQDLSARDVQRRGPAPQFSLGKSFPGSGPIGPWVATLDEIADRDAIPLSCELNGERVQGGTTAEMIFSVPELIAYVSGICTLLPGDLLFTGTPAGVGARRTPPRFLRPDDVLVSRVDGVGEIVQRFVAGPEEQIDAKAMAKGA
jgi:2-keto-4-pentenoate hydratase/2-oxohepta-3-ene-1,7-dioic acid hydratase in catechol pathway